MREHLALLAGLGSPVMVFAETTKEIINNVGAPASARPKIESAAEWKHLGQRFTAVADHLQAKGVRMAVHHHMGTVIQTAEDVDRLMENTGPAVGLLLDTGHMTFAGGDPLAVAKRHGDRIVHVHCKDIRRYALAACQGRDVSFSQAVLEGLFTAPGDGMVDYPGLLKILAGVRYSGWLVQEAEQDPRIAHPLTYASLGCAHLKKVCATAKLKLA